MYFPHMARVTKFLRLIARMQKMTGAKRVKAAARAAKTSKDVAKTMGRSSGLLGRIARIGGATAAGGAAGAAAAGGGDNASSAEGSGGSGVGGATAGTGKKRSDAPSDDPQIVIPEIDLSQLPATAERTDLTIIEETPIDVNVDPKPIVENYFDDNFTPIKVSEAAISQGTEINAISNSIGTLAAQIAAIKGLEKAVDDAREQNEKTKRDNERRRDEADVEKPDALDSAIGGMFETGGALVGGFLSRFILPSIALLGAGIASAFADAFEGVEEPISEWADSLSWLDGIEEKYVQASVALSTLGVSVSKGFSALKGGLASKGSEFITKLSKTGAGMKLGSAASKTVEAFSKISKVLTPNPHANSMLAGLMRMRSWFSGFAGAIGKVIASVTKGLAKLPTFVMKMFKGLLAKPAKYLTIFVAIDAMIDAAMAYMFNTISVEEFHTRCKKNLNYILGLVAGTWITTIIFTAVGTALGSVIPFFGNIAGMVLGFVMGVLFGEDVWDIIGADDVVNAMYDKWIMGKDNAFDGLGVKIIESGKARLEKILKDYSEFFINNLGEPLGLVDRIATVEEMEEKYKDMALEDIAWEAMDKINEDENALYYVADSIKSADHLAEINSRMLNKHNTTLEGLAKSKLSDAEYEEFSAILSRAIGGGGGTGVMPTAEEMMANQMKDPDRQIDEKVAYQVTHAMGGGVIGTFETREEAEEFAKYNQGYVDKIDRADAKGKITQSKYKNQQRPAKSAEETNLETLAVEIASALDDTGEGAVSDLIEAAVAVSDAGYEKVSATYERLYQQPLSVALEEKLGGEETARAVERIMRAGSAEEIAEVAVEEGFSAVLEKALPDVSDEMKDKIGQIIPIINQIASRSSERGSIAGNQSRSQIESATPSFSTNDSFISQGSQT